MALQINGVGFDSYLAKGSLVHTNALRSEPDTLDFTLNPGTPKPASGAAVTLTLPDGSQLFGGEVTGFPEAPVGYLSMGYSVQCSDWRPRANHKLIDKRYQAVTAGTILVDLFATYAPEFDTSGIDLGGPVLPAVRFKASDNTRLTDVMDKLHQITGYIWDITPDKRVVWEPPGTTPCPFSLTDDSRNFQDLTVNVIREGMANRLRVMGGYYPAAKTLTDSWTGDGVTTGFRLSKVPASLDTYVVFQGDFSSGIDSQVWNRTDVNNPTPPAGHVSADGYIFTQIQQGAVLSESGWVQVVGGDGTWGDSRLMSATPVSRGKDGGRIEFEVWCGDVTGHFRVGLWDPANQAALAGEAYGFHFDAGTIKPSEGGVDQTALASVTYTADKTVRVRVMPKEAGGATYWVNTDDTGDLALPADERVAWRPSFWTKLYDSNAGTLPLLTLAPIFNQDGVCRVRRVRVYNPLYGAALTVAGVAKVVGLEHVDEDSGCDALIAKQGDLYFLGFFGDVIPASGAAVAFTYLPGIPIDFYLQDDASIAAVKAIENPDNDPNGSDGVIEDVLYDTSFTSLQLAMTAGAQRLSITSNPEVQLTTRTREQGARSGQVLSANLTPERSGRDLVGSFLIQQVQTQSLGDGVNFEATITASSKLKGLDDFLLDLLKRGKPLANIDDDNSPITLVAFASDTLTLSDSGTVGGVDVAEYLDTLTLSDAGSVESGPVGPFIYGPDADYAFSRASVAYDPYTGAEVASGEPRFPVVAGAQGVMVEEATTNLATFSDQLDNAAWTRLGSNVTANATTAPGGTATADKLIESNTTGSHRTRSNANTLTTSTAYTFTVYAKAAERNWLAMAFTNFTNWSGGNPIAYFDLSAGVVGNVGTGATGKIKDVGGGWYRCQLTATYTGTGTSESADFYIASANGTISYTGTTGNGLYLWRTQFEAKGYATSSIQTTSASATRAAESFTGPVEGVMVPASGFVAVEFWADDELIKSTMSRYYTVFDKGTDPSSYKNMVRISRGASGNWYFGLADNAGTYQLASSSNNYIVPRGRTIAIAVWDSTEQAIWINGVKVGHVDNPAHIPSVGGGNWGLGNVITNFNGEQHLNQPIFATRFGTSKPSDAELSAITPATGLPAAITGQTYGTDFDGTLQPYQTPWAVYGQAAYAS